MEISHSPHITCQHQVAVGQTGPCRADRLARLHQLSCLFDDGDSCCCIAAVLAATELPVLPHVRDSVLCAAAAKASPPGKVRGFHSPAWTNIIMRFAGSTEHCRGRPEGMGSLANCGECERGPGGASDDEISSLSVDHPVIATA